MHRIGLTKIPVAGLRVSFLLRLSRAIDGLNEQPSADSTGAYALLAVLQAEANDAAGAFAGEHYFADRVVLMQHRTGAMRCFG